MTIERAVKLAIEDEGRVLLRLAGIDMQQVHGELTHPISYLSEPAYPTLSANNHSNTSPSKSVTTTWTKSLTLKNNNSELTRFHKLPKVSPYYSQCAET